MSSRAHIAVPCDAAGIAQAAQVLRAGGLVGMPTETVYGLAASVADPDAVRRVFSVKGRPADHPLIVHIAEPAELDDWACDIPAYARTLAEKLWPGPLTLVLPAKPETPRLVTGGEETVGLRVPAHDAARQLIRQAGAVAAPSANRFGRVSPTSAHAVLEELAEALDAQDVVLDGGECSIGIESTIVDCTANEPRVLRPGFYSEEVILATAGVTVADVHRTDGASHDTNHTSPRVSGSLPGHYAPTTPVRLVSATELGQLDVSRLVHACVLSTEDIAVPSQTGMRAQAKDAVEFARILYATLRAADERQVDEVLVVPPPAEGIGIAILDRLTRAAHGSNHFNL